MSISDRGYLECAVAVEIFTRNDYGESPENHSHGCTKKCCIDLEIATYLWCPTGMIEHVSDSVDSSVSRPEVWRLSEADLVAAAQGNETATRQRQAARYELIAQLVARGIPTARGYGKTEAYLSDVFHISRSEAKKWVRRAVALHPTQGLTGLIPAQAPATAQAAADGALGDEHIDVVLDLLDRIPDDVPVDEREGYEKAVADYQRVATPAAARKLVDRIIALVDPDGTLPREKELARPARELIKSWTRGGDLAIKGRLDPETGRALEALLSPLTKPRPAEDGTPRPPPDHRRTSPPPRLRGRDHPRRPRHPQRSARPRPLPADGEPGPTPTAEPARRRLHLHQLPPPRPLDRSPPH